MDRISQIIQESINKFVNEAEEVQTNSQLSEEEWEQEYNKLAAQFKQDVQNGVCSNWLFQLLIEALKKNTHSVCIRDWEDTIEYELGYDAIPDSVQRNQGQLDAWTDSSYQLLCSYNADFEFEPYDPGDYWTPPSGGRCDLKKVEWTFFEWECEYGKISFTKEQMSMLKQFFDNTISIDTDLSDVEEPEPYFDEDAWRHWAD